MLYEDYTAKLLGLDDVVIDMNPHFREVAEICFPQATIVIDRYHVTRQAIWALERVRKEEQKHLSAD